MLNKIAEFILDKRFRDLEERIAKMEKKLQANAKRICEENRILPIVETPPRRK